MAIGYISLFELSRAGGRCLNEAIPEAGCACPGMQINGMKN